MRPTGRRRCNANPSKMLPPPSPEQAQAIELVKSGRNVVASAVAGGGKSTFLRHCCAESEVPIQVLTYNKTLQIDLEAKIDAPHIVSTFHGLASTFFGTCKNDNELIHVLETKPAPNQPFLFKKIFVDETQALLLAHTTRSHLLTCTHPQTSAPRLPLRT